MSSSHEGVIGNECTNVKTNVDDCWHIFDERSWRRFDVGANARMTSASETQAPRILDVEGR